MCDVFDSAVFLSLNQVADPMREDMLRRAYYSPAKLAAFAFPVLGPLAYLVMRPKLSVDE